MKASPKPLPKENRQLGKASQREKDTIHYLDFIPKDGQPTGRSTLLNDPWGIRLPCNPGKSPQLIEDAIRKFEGNHQVASWREIASDCKVHALWSPSDQALSNHQRPTL